LTLIAAPSPTAVQSRGRYDGGFAAASLQEAHPRALAKAGTELVEGRTLAPGTSDPSPALEEYVLSI